MSNRAIAPELAAPKASFCQSFLTMSIPKTPPPMIPVDTKLFLDVVSSYRNNFRIDDENRAVTTVVTTALEAKTETYDGAYVGTSTITSCGFSYCSTFF